MLDKKGMENQNLNPLFQATKLKLLGQQILYGLDFCTYVNIQRLELLGKI